MRKLKLYEAKVYLTDGTELWMSTQASSKEEAIERFHEELEDEWIGPRDIDYIEIKEAQPDRDENNPCMIPENTKDVPTPEQADEISLQSGEPPRFVKRIYTVFRDSGQRRYTLRIPWEDLLDLEMFRDPDKFPPRLKVPVVFDIPNNRLIIYLGEGENDG